MNILHITPIAPGNKGGGEIAVQQMLLSAVQNGNTIDYVGPEIEDKNLRQKYRQLYELEVIHNPLIRVWDILHRKTNQRYRAWKNAGIDYAAYDVILLEFARMPYVLEQVPAEKLIVRAHNVEKDYVKHCWQHERNLHNYLDCRFVPHGERMLLEQAAEVLAITKQDAERLVELYGIDRKKIKIVSVCMDVGQEAAHLTARPDQLFTMILNGSLWFGPNYTGIKWFLDEVYPKLQFEHRLIIAGRRPNQELIDRAVADATIELIDSPPEMAPYLQQADLALAPVFDGSGMKVKVAEALAYGLPVVGTTHALIGYQITDGENSYRADTAEEFEHCISTYQALKAEQQTEMHAAARALYEECYSMEAGAKLLQAALEEIGSLDR